MKCFIILLLSGVSFGSQVKEMGLKPNDVGVINTALGYSTVVQVSQKPLNVVIGDQSSFRVEYIGNNITIKPLKSGTRTNLFIFTENDRFNLTIHAGSESLVDYVVHLKRIFEDPKQVRFLGISRQIKGTSLTLIKMTKSTGGTFIDFELQNLSKEKKEILPESFRIIQDKVPAPIKSLYLDKNILNSSSVATGSILFTQISQSKPFAIWVGLRNERPQSFRFSLEPRKQGGIHGF